MSDLGAALSRIGALTEGGEKRPTRVFVCPSYQQQAQDILQQMIGTSIRLIPHTEDNYQDLACYTIDYGAQFSLYEVIKRAWEEHWSDKRKTFDRWDERAGRWRRVKKPNWNEPIPPLFKES